MNSHNTEADIYASVMGCLQLSDTKEANLDLNLLLYEDKHIDLLSTTSPTPAIDYLHYLGIAEEIVQWMVFRDKLSTWYPKAELEEDDRGVVKIIRGNENRSFEF